MGSQSLIRQWRLLRQLADARVGYTVKELQADMSVSIETIRRDLNALGDAGFRVRESIGFRGVKRWRVEGFEESFGFTITDLLSIYMGRQFLEPFAGRGSLYLIAWSSRRGEIRTCKMDRIEDVHSTKLPAAVPQNFNLTAWLEHSFGVFRSGSTELQTIRIHFARDVARYAQESRWHGSQKLTLQPDGSLIAEFSLPDTQEIKRWIMRFGPNATVLEPQELVDQAERDLAVMLGNYRCVQKTNSVEKTKKRAPDQATRRKRR